LAVSNEAIVNKMIAELQQAKTALNNQRDFKLHISHIQLLTELLLDEHGVEDESVHNVLATLEKKTEHIERYEETPNDDMSIFDF